MCFLGLFQEGMASGWWAAEMTFIYLFGGFLLGGSNAENWREEH